MGRDPAYPRGKADSRRVNQVSWYDAIEFCNRLSKSKGLSSAYDRDVKNQVIWIKKADGFRLPSEAEWGYACRADSNTKYFFGDDQKLLKDFAWCRQNARGKPHPVGTKKPNKWRLYDMHGNVWEWCWDWHADYSRKSVRDLDGPSTGKYKVLRGGSFGYPAKDLHSAIRSKLRSGLKDWDR